MVTAIKGNFKRIFSAILKMVVLPVIILLLLDKTSIAYFRDFFSNFTFEKFDVCFMRYLMFSKTTMFDLPMIISFAVVILNIFCTATMLTLLCFLFISVISFILKNLRFKKINYINKNANEDSSSLYLLTSRFLC